MYLFDTCCSIISAVLYTDIYVMCEWVTKNTSNVLLISYHWPNLIIHRAAV